MKKPFKLLAFREARKTLGFVLPVDSGGHNNFRAAKALPRRGEAMAEIRGGYPLKDGLIEFQLLRQLFPLRSRSRVVGAGCGLLAGRLNALRNANPVLKASNVNASTRASSKGE